MIRIQDEDIKSLKILDRNIINWVREAFLLKEKSILPHKISLTFNDGKNFYNTMPTIMPSINSAGVKIVSRYPERSPSIDGNILLYEFSSGNLLSFMDAAWITAKRTGAVAYLAVETFAKNDFESIALIGLGQAGKAFLDMVLTKKENKLKLFKLMKYKNHAEETKAYLKRQGVNNVVICDNVKDLIIDSDVIVSAVTVANNQFGEDNWFKKGVLVVPIHTRGFQNCDLFFDKVFADDREHVSNFKYFKYFKHFNEISDVLSNKVQGRTNSEERILSYNIGIALHDILIARKVYDLYTIK